jgi:hypothetical protein
MPLPCKPWTTFLPHFLQFKIIFKGFKSINLPLQQKV